MGAGGCWSSGPASHPEGELAEVLLAPTLGVELLNRGLRDEGCGGQPS